MTLSPDERAAFLNLLPHLGDDTDPRAAVAFARTHRDALRVELGALPGEERVRAGAIRLLDHLADTLDDHEAACREAGNALLVPPADSPVDRATRHPAWIGLATLELADHRDDWEEGALDRAIELAGRAFQAFGALDVGEGEVAWAMAEEADQVGWSARAAELLEEAITRPFADPAHRAEAQLLAGIRRDQRGEDGAALLQAAFDTSAAEPRTRIHAGWVLAHVRHRTDPQGALVVLDAAAAMVDADAEPNVIARFADQREAWTA